MSLPVPGAAPAAACCPPLSVQALAPEAAGQVAPLFKALSDPVRLRLLSLIASTAEMCVCDLTEAFDLTGATISHHLRVLRETGLVDCERRGTWVYYWLKTGALDQLGALLSAAPGPTDQDELISGGDEVIRMLADPLRARIVELLAVGPASVSQLVAGTGAKQPNVSGHLKQLREAGLVTTERQGRFTRYRLVPEVIRRASRQLDHLADRVAANAGVHRDPAGGPAPASA
jgi:ArsR family transcriptional regulator